MFDGSQRRMDPGRLIRGKGRFLADLDVGATAHTSFIRSPVAHARIRSVEVEEAISAPGVLAVFTATDLNVGDIPGNTGRGPDAHRMTRPVLARSTVRYVGEPIAVVVASTPQQAADAASLAWVDLEEIPTVADCDTALVDDVLLFPGAGTNVVERSDYAMGEVDVEQDATVVVEVESPRLAPMPIEPLGILARKDSSGTLTVWCGHQGPHRLQRQLAEILSRPRSSIRVVVPDVGGAFGMKGMLFPEYVVVSALAEIMDMAVSWVSGRREMSIGGTHGRGQHHTMTVEGSKDGRIRRLRADILMDVGAYPHNGAQIPRFTRLVTPGLYDIDRVEVAITTVVTNRAPVGSYRGAGRPEAALALEHCVDIFARKIGMDPVDVRLRNLIRPDALPFESATGAVYDSGDYPAALLAVAEELDLDWIRQERQSRLEQGGDLLGVGFAAFVERAGGAVDSGEYARVEIDPSAREVIVRSGSTDTGQGHGAIWCRIARDILGLDEVVLFTGDTTTVAEGVGTFASRSAQIGAAAVSRTSQSLLERARIRAAAHLEAAPEDIVYRAGEFGVVGSPGVSVSVWELAEQEPLAEEEMFVPGAQTFPYGVHAAIVEVDRDTGEVRVLRIVALDDCGTVLDTRTVEGQAYGSLTQGLGQALFEEMRYDDLGQPLTSSLLDYAMPHAVDVPPIVTRRTEHPAPSNPLGVKGAGEAGCIGLPPAILNAVTDALSGLGVTRLGLPMRPFRVWEAMTSAQAQ